MPYKIDTMHIKLPRQLDRRVKLSEEDKEEIKNLFNSWESIKFIATEYNVSRRTIQFIIYPERLIKCKAQYKERRLDWRYYDKEYHRKAMKHTRDYRYKNIII